MTGADRYQPRPYDPTYEPPVYDMLNLDHEVPAVADAIRLYVQVVEADRAERAGLTPPPDVDRRYIVGYLDGVARSMALCDPWCQDANEVLLWRRCALMHGAGPGANGAYAYARGAAWREYMRRSAEAIAREVVA